MAVNEIVKDLLSKADAFVRDLLLTSRLVILGKTERIHQKLTETAPEKLMAFEAVIGFGVGIQSFSVIRTIGFPFFLTGFTVVWLLLYTIVSDTKREKMMSLYGLFFGSSTFLLPGVIPVVGPLVLQILFIGWPFVLARLIARSTGDAPGKVFFDLTAPLVLCWFALQMLMLFVGKLFIST